MSGWSQVGSVVTSRKMNRCMIASVVPGGGYALFEVHTEKLVENHIQQGCKEMKLFR